MTQALFAIVFAFLCCYGFARAAEVEWQPEASMGHQLFRSLIITTASVRPVEPDDQEAEKPDPYLLGERFGLVGVSVKAPAENSKVKVTIKENDLMATASWSGELAEVDKDRSEERRVGKECRSRWSPY